MLSLQPDEYEIWDEYAKSALVQIMTAKNVEVDTACELAAQFADSLVKQRRKRRPNDITPVRS